MILYLDIAGAAGLSDEDGRKVGESTAGIGNGVIGDVVDVELAAAVVEVT